MRHSAFRLSGVLLAVVLGCAPIACGGGGGDKGGLPTGDDGGTGDDGSTATSTSEAGGSDGSTGTSTSETGGDGGTGTTSETGSDGGTGTSTSDGGGGSDGAGSDGSGADTGPLSCGTDSDGDGISDKIEQSDNTGTFVGKTLDTDKDGIPDYLDTDSDNDGIPDAVEWFTPSCDNVPFAELNDADGDGIPNFRDLDSDGNGLIDAQEACPPTGMPGFPAGCALTTPCDFDGDGIPDWLDPDNDHDSSKADKTLGVKDVIELSDNTGKYVGLIDTDHDGIPDVWDRDSDNDFIYDLDDGIVDSDGDGLPNFRDTDSDNDKVPDWCEARANPSPSASDLPKPLLDTNGDGVLDYLDHDSDGDLLADGKEDVNGNCVVDTTETDRIKFDTGGHSPPISDLITTILGGVTCAKDPTCTPAKLGKFYFIEPYSTDGSALPTPTSSPLALNTDLQQGDVAFIVDTTGSMSPELTNLKSSLSTSIIPALTTKIPNLGIGIAGHDDYPYGSYGSPGCGAGDWPFYLPSGGTITTSVATAQAAVNSLTIHCGYDLPESQNEAIYAAVTGAALPWPGGSVGPFSVPAGTKGAMNFRSGSLPIVVEITDAPFHNGYSVATGSYQNPYSFSAYTSDDVVNALNAIGAKFIGVAADNGGRASGSPLGHGDPYNYMAYITDKTNSNVPPSAFGGSCLTGVSGAAITADGPGGNCRSIYSINDDGTGLTNSIVSGVQAILASVKFDVYVQAVPDPGAVDSVNSFMQKLEPTPTGTDPVTGVACTDFSATGGLADRWVGPKAIVAGSDGVNDTIKGVNPGPKYCFSVVPKPNTTVKPTTDPQLFTATLNVRAQNATSTLTLGAPRQVLFIVPPVLN